MNIKKILFPTDFSEYNSTAFEFASRLAAESDATLHVVHVHDSRELATAFGEASFVNAEQWDEQKRLIEQRLKKIVPPGPAIKHKRHALIGVPDDEIVAFAVDHKIDLIVMASHGRSGISRLVMGSVAEAVMRKAPCPVLIVKQPHPEEAKVTVDAVQSVSTEH